MSQLRSPSSRTVLAFSSVVTAALFLASCGGEFHAGGSAGKAGSPASAGRDSSGSGGSGASGGGGISGTGGTGDATGGAGDATKHPAWRVREALCDWTRACCETAGFFGVFDRCVAQSSGDADQFRASIAAGRLSIDDDALRSCADHIRSSYLGCDFLSSALDTFATFSDCVDGIAGHVPIGAACTLSEDCIGAGTGRVKCIDGFCVDGAPNIPDGAACTLDDRCDTNSYCDGTCRPKKPVGASCTSGHECAPLHCNQVTGTCATLPDRAECHP